MFDPISYLPTIIEGLLGTILGGIKGKVDNATAIELKKAEKRIEAELITLQHKYDLEKLKYAQRHELQIKLLSLLEKIDMVQLSSPAQIEAFKDLMQVALSLAADNYVEKIENMAPRLRNITPAALPNPPKPFNFDFQGATANVQEVTFADDLGGGINLEMVAIPGGTFWMGSPDNEPQRNNDESPRHLVDVAAFLMGKFPVTQAQWRAVAGLPKINTDLDPDPSYFKGANRPVEQVSWNEAMEFCRRLSKKTGRNYRLPSEAEWEYACRACTNTPFHFGKTITTDLANYCGVDRTIDGTLYKGTYGNGSLGIYREQTTEVGNFPTNAFGLYDMHGNVWEWCADGWYKNDEGAPNDGSIWLSSDEAAIRVMRGGSWYNSPWHCRSARRGSGNPGGWDNGIGFRAVCSVE